MALLAKLQEDMKAALKAGEKAKLSTVRMLIAELKNEEKRVLRPLNEQEELVVLDRQAKRRQESIRMYKEAERDDLVATEQGELEIIQTYLPRPYTAEEVKALLRKAIAETNARKSDFGRVMKEVMPKLKGRFPGSEVKPLLDEVLAEYDEEPATGGSEPPAEG
ncbi:MAG: GatB/YqeY domain-containing protein [Myxococcales bacterium]|nr:GatB/YqeY domain-containing protein [Myxococcales bacterium]